MEQLPEIRTYARKNAIPIMRDDGCEFICNYIREHNVKRVLEIGTAIGFSAIEFARAAEDVHVITLEVDIDRCIKAKQNIHDQGLDDKITAINCNALMYDLEGRFDLIFIDAAKAQYIKFFEKYKANLAPDGVFISDNLAFHGMVEDISLTHNDSTIKLVKKIIKYIDFLKANEEFETTFYECGDGISVSKRRK